MKLNISLYVFLVFCLCCTFENNKKIETLELVTDEIVLSDNIKSILEQFIQENPCKDCLNEIYINKVYEIRNIDYKTIIVIYQLPFKNRGFDKSASGSFLKLNFKTYIFYLYCGLEDYFFKTLDYRKDTVLIPTGAKQVAWTIYDKKDTLIIKKTGDIPFSAFYPSDRDTNDR
jgi:hypothetical protein